jgi:hypothetical protein
MDDSGTALKEGVALRWSFGVSVVAALLIMIVRLAWMIFSLPSDDNGGGMTGAMVVSGIEFVRNTVILEIVRRVFLRVTRRNRT